MRINDSVLDEIRSRIDIVDLIGARIPLKKAGTMYKACCPFHHEKTPSFNINPNKQLYHCFGCGESGDIFSFLMKQDGLTFMDAVQMLAAQCGVEIKEEKDDGRAQKRKRLYALHAELAAFYQRCLNKLASADVARQYLATRQLDANTINTFQIGYAPDKQGAILTWGEKYGYSANDLIDAGILAPPNAEYKSTRPFDRFHGRLMFSICDRQGRVVAFSGRILDKNAHPAKYVNSPETLIFTKSKILYALDKAAAYIVKHPRREAIICEGQIDVIRCHACGFQTAVASQGTAFTKDHVDILKKHADSVVLVFDGDAAGQKAAIRTGALFLEAEIPVRVATLPPEDDPDSLLRDKGPEAFQRILDDAVSITAFQIRTLLEKEPHPDTIDAINRVARAVIELLSDCPGAVLKARLLDEAATRLHIPLSALEEDLTKNIAAKRQRAKFATPPAEETPDYPESAPEIEAPSPEEYLDAPPRPAPPPTAERAFCEFLIEQENDPTILAVLRNYLPLDILMHPFTRCVVDAWMTAATTGEDALATLPQTIDPTWRDLLDTLLAPKDKTRMSELSPEELARDYVRALWIARVEHLRGALSAESSPENDAQRFTLTTLLKSLRTQPWDVISKHMTTQIQRGHS